MLGILGALLAMVLIGVGGLALFFIGLKYAIVAVKEFFNWLINK